METRNYVYAQNDAARMFCYIAWSYKNSTICATQTMVYQYIISIISLLDYFNLIFPANIYLFKVNNRNASKSCKILC